MKNENIYPPENLYNSTIMVIRDPDRFRLNNFFLTGEDKLKKESQVGIFGWLAAFPQQKDDYLGIVFINQDNPERLRRFCKGITEFKISERVKKSLKADQDPLLADNITKNLALNRFPSIIMVRGIELKTDKLLDILFCPWGMRPREALVTIQKVAREKYWQITSQNN